MNLSPDHQHELWSIGARGLATLVAVLLFWGTTAPTIFPQYDIYALSRYSGIFATVVLVGCFRSSYWNLLTQNLPKKKRKFGFLLFWFCGSLFFNLVWQVPYWTIPAISQAPKTMDGLYWKIMWWSYTLHDSWYECLSPLVVVFEVWYLLGNLVGAYGLYRYVSAGKLKNFNDARRRLQLYNETLVLFCICGALQCYNATIYVFLSYYNYLDSLDNDPSPPPQQQQQQHVLSQVIFWGLHGFWVVASAVATIFSAQLLLDNYRLLLNHYQPQRSQSS